MKVRRKRTYEANQWFKNGDHPSDNSVLVSPDKDSTTQFEPFLSEGEVVKSVSSFVGRDKLCPSCGRTPEEHGTTFGDTSPVTLVCPGDWIVEVGVSRGVYTDKEFNEIFEKE